MTMTDRPSDADTARVVAEWKPVIGYEEKYEVSSHGSVRSIDRTMTNALGQSRYYKGKTLKQRIRNGYPVVDLWNINPKTVSVHRIVAEAFVPNPDNKPEVNHVNGTKTDNIATNLEWVSRSENAAHAYQSGLTHASPVYGSDNGNSRLNHKSAESIRKMSAEGKSSYEIAKRFGVNPSTIQRVLRRETWNT